jgi:hypothetical protein
MKRLLALLVVAAVLAVVLSCLFLAQNNAGGTVRPPGSLSQQFCVNAVTNAAAMRYAISSGVDCFRTDVDFNGSQVNAIATEAEEGVQYLGILDYETVGAQTSPSGCAAGCNWTLATWNASIEKAIADYPDVHSWEIYNEPIVGIFVGGYENGSASNYFNMIRSAYSIIKGHDRNATVVCFGGAQLFPPDTAAQEYQFYARVWGYGASKYCDAISLHIYSPSYDLNQDVSQGTTFMQWYGHTIGLYENMTKKPIWITETGIPSNIAAASLSEQTQASFLVQEFDFLASYSFIKKIYWFHLSGLVGSDDYGLLNATTLLPKPAWLSFLSFSRNGTR